ncbi:glycosyltransferase family 2 protein [candidate division NPL-UPA2 bacterium]|nr:glycosyltransferase family 2 protein [candidate division NPL-UPA2 bacterium]
MKIGVLIPAYNEEGTIFSLVRGLLALSAGGQGLVEEVVIIDDGSTDNTREEAKRAGAQVISHPENRGKGAALKTGFRYALQKGFEAIITMDGDGQHDGTEIPAFLGKAQEKEAHIIIGNRMGNVGNMPFVRLWTNRITSWIISALTHQKIDDSQSGYRLIRKKVLQNINLVTSYFDAESELLIKASQRGYRIVSIPIRTIYKDKFVSKIKPLKDTLRFIRLIFRLRFFKQ